MTARLPTNQCWHGDASAKGQLIVLPPGGSSAPLRGQLFASRALSHFVLFPKKKSPIQINKLNFIVDQSVLKKKQIDD